jgi:uncharacterized membrane protein
MNSLSAFRTEQRPDADQPPDGALLGKGLGFFSLALGLTEIAAPKALANFFGIDPGGATAAIVRAQGLREIAAGVGILLQPRRPVPIAMRVAGDLVDLALVGAAAGFKRKNTLRLAGAALFVLGATALDAYATKRTARAYEEANRPVIFSVTINKPPREVYDFWRKLEQLPQFMDYLESVTETGTDTSHWVAKLPIGGTVEWDARITDDRPGELIAWESVEGSKIKTKGKVTFARAPGRMSTEVRVEMQLAPMGFRPSPLIAKLATKPQVKGDLRRFKQILETGEVLLSDASRHPQPHPAQPSESGKTATFTAPGERSQVSSSSVKARPIEPQIAASNTPPDSELPKKGFVS